VQWESILRSVSAQLAYRWLHHGDYNPASIADCLIKDRRLPRSLAFCHAEISANLDYLAKDYDMRHHCHDLSASILQRLQDSSIESIFDAGLHEFLLDFIRQNAELGGQIEQDYRFYG